MKVIKINCTPNEDRKKSLMDRLDVRLDDESLHGYDATPKLLRTNWLRAVIASTFVVGRSVGRCR